jgi:group I intron endonuclease
MIIYKVTNLINGKVYIGQTVQDLKERWKGHQSGYSGCVALKFAIQKYGIENFTIEQVDHAYSLEELNKKEGNWIVQMNSLSPNGYNLKSGGDQPRLCQESIDKANATKKERNIRPWNEGLDKTDPRVAGYIRYGKDTHAYGKVGYRKGKKASKETKRKISEVQLGRVVSEQTKKKMSDSRKNSPYLNKIEKPILCTTNNTVYKSMSEAGRVLGLNVSNICNVVKGKRKVTCGYSFEYLKIEKSE